MRQKNRWYVESSTLLRARSVLYCEHRRTVSPGSSIGESQNQMPRGVRACSTRTKILLSGAPTYLGHRSPAICASCLSPVDCRRVFERPPPQVEYRGLYSSIERRPGSNCSVRERVRAATSFKYLPPLRFGQATGGEWTEAYRRWARGL